MPICTSPPVRAMRVRGVSNDHFDRLAMDVVGGAVGQVTGPVAQADPADVVRDAPEAAAHELSGAAARQPVRSAARPARTPPQTAPASLAERRVTLSANVLMYY